MLSTSSSNQIRSIKSRHASVDPKVAQSMLHPIKLSVCYLQMLLARQVLEGYKMTIIFYENGLKLSDGVSRSIAVITDMCRTRNQLKGETSEEVETVHVGSLLKI